VLDPDFDFADMCDLPILRRHKPGPVPWDELDVDPDDFPLPRPPKPGPPTWDGLMDRQYRIRRMVFLLMKGYSYRAIAKDLGVARTTVDRMKPDMAQFNLFAPTPSPPAERVPEDFTLRHVRFGSGT
jgi:Homeodomain-like domain